MFTRARFLIPKGTTYRHMPRTPTTAKVVESVAPIEFTEHRQVGRHSPIDFGARYSRAH